MNAWSLLYEGFDPATEGLREALCTVGNGYVASRGAGPEAVADDVHYPGTYVAGLYDRLATEIAGRSVENEDLVNVPNWLSLAFRVEDGEWFDLRKVDVLEYRQELDLRRAVLTRRVRFEDAHGRVTGVSQRRFVSMRDPHLAALETTLVAENWSGGLEVRSALDGRVTNSGVPRYRQLRRDHLVPLRTHTVDAETVAMAVETRGSRIRIAQAARTRVLRGGEPVPADRAVEEEPGFIGHRLLIEAREGEATTIEKIVTLYTSRDHAVHEPEVAADTWVRRFGRFEPLLARHVLAWDHLWRRFDMRIDGPERAQLVLRLHVFHLLQTVSPNTIDLDVGVPARGLHGEAYRGHVFWDELFILPFLNLRLPILTRTLLDYRYRRLGEARCAARAAGYRGAMYPWQSGS
ncbi:MAG TPA: hypothetical protein VK977_07415, partial [Actinomycetota bacterium]|nr:hypothetical protein [Actinomycetota bacterium]